MVCAWHTVGPQQVQHCHPALACTLPPTRGARGSPHHTPDPLPGLQGPLSKRERTTHLSPTRGAVGAQEASGTPMRQATLLSAEGGTVPGPHRFKVQSHGCLLGVEPGPLVPVPSSVNEERAIWKIKSIAR